MATGGRCSPRSDPFKEAQRRFLAAGKGLGPGAKRERRPSTAAPAGRKRGRKRGAGGRRGARRRGEVAAAPSRRSSAAPPPAAPRPLPAAPHRPPPRALASAAPPPGRWGARASGTGASARPLPPPRPARRPLSQASCASPCPRGRLPPGIFWALPPAPRRLCAPQLCVCPSAAGRAGGAAVSVPFWGRRWRGTSWAGEVGGPGSLTMGPWSGPNWASRR